MKVLAVACVFAIGCTTSAGGPGSGSSVHLGEPGRLAIAGDCVVVAEPSSLVCVPRAGGGDPHELVKTPGRTYVAVAGDGDAVVATSTDDPPVELDRVALDGTVTRLASAAASTGAGELALADKQVVLSTGSQLLLVDGTGGGIVATLAQASGVIGAVAQRAGTVYYTDDQTLHEVDLTGQQVPLFDGMVTLALAADASTAVAGERLVGDSQFSFVDSELADEDCELHGTLSRVVLADGHPFALTDLGIFDAAGPVAEVPLARAAGAFDLAVDDQTIYWITRAGELDRAARM